MLTKVTILHLLDLHKELTEFTNPENNLGFVKEFYDWVITHWGDNNYFATEIVDLGYVVSTYPKINQEKLINTAKTYCDFINSNTGNQVVTHASGCGMACETYDQKLSELFMKNCKEIVDQYIQKHHLIIYPDDKEPNTNLIFEIIDGMDHIGPLENGLEEAAENIDINFGYSACAMEPYTSPIVNFDRFNQNEFGTWTYQDFLTAAILDLNETLLIQPRCA